MKKSLLWIVVLVLSISMVAAFSLYGCKVATAEEVAAEEEVAVEEEAVVEEEAAVEEERLVFAFVIYPDLAAPFEGEVVRGWNEACSLFGVDTTIGIADYDEAKVISLVDVAIASDVDGIYTYTWQDPVGLTPSFQQALDKGIQVAHMSVQNTAFTPAQVPFIGMNYRVQGHVLGTYWAERLTAEGRVTDLHIATFMDNLASPLEIDRRQGFLDGLTDGGIEYIAPDPTQTDPDLTVSLDIVGAYLLAYPETDLICGTGGTPTAACALALDSMGFAPGEVWLAGFDLYPEATVGIRAGYGAVNVDEVFPYGFLGATALYLRAKEGLVIGDLPITSVMVDETNIDKYAD